MAEKGGGYLKVYCFSVVYQKFYGEDKKSWKQLSFHETFVDRERFRIAHMTQLIPGFLTFTYFFVPLYGSEVWRISVLKNCIISNVGILTCLHSWTNPWVLLVLYHKHFTRMANTVRRFSKNCCTTSCKAVFKDALNNIYNW